MMSRAGAIGVIAAVLALAGPAGAQVEIVVEPAPAQPMPAVGPVSVPAQPDAGAATVRVGSEATGGGGLHIPAGRAVNWNWALEDGAGFRWDLTAQGMVADGTNDCYDGGMQLAVNDQTFSHGGPGRGSEDGREVEVGPWQAGPVRVWRRVYVDPKLGYCRWIDVFENPDDQEQALQLRYYSNMGEPTRAVHTSSGRDKLAKDDWGAVTSGGQERSSRPAVVHVWAAPQADVRPRFEVAANTDNLYYHVSLKLAAGETAGLCFFEAQRPGGAEAKALLASFDLGGELAKVPAPLRKLLVNMRGGRAATLAPVELPRGREHDVVSLPRGRLATGTLLNEQYVLETAWGPMEFEAARVVGLLAGPGGVRLALTDGQVVAGRLTSGPLRLKTADGQVRTYRPADIDAAGYRISPERPGEVALHNPVVVLRDAQRLLFEAGSFAGAFYTRHGSVALAPEHLKALVLDTPGGGLHRALLTNGSVLSGLLETAQPTLKLALGPEATLSRASIAKFVFPAGGAKARGLHAMDLANGDHLLGRLKAETLTIETEGGPREMRVEALAGLERDAASFDVVTLRPREGEEVTGRLSAPALRFQIVPGPELTVSIAHVRRIRFDGPGDTPAEPEAQPEPATGATPPGPGELTCPECGKTFSCKVMEVMAGHVVVACPHCGATVVEDIGKAFCAAGAPHEVVELDPAVRAQLEVGMEEAIRQAFKRAAEQGP